MNEEWREIEGTNGRYEVSNLGNIRSWLKLGEHGGWLTEPRILTCSINQYGYRRASLCVESGKLRHVQVHREVCRAFNGEPTGPHTRHLNGDKLDNRAENLAWGTAAENVFDTIQHGRFRPRGVLQPARSI